MKLNNIQLSSIEFRHHFKIFEITVYEKSEKRSKAKRLQKYNQNLSLLFTMLLV